MKRPNLFEIIVEPLKPVIEFARAMAKPEVAEALRYATGVPAAPGMT